MPGCVQPNALPRSGSTVKISYLSLRVSIGAFRTTVARSEISSASVSGSRRVPAAQFLNFVSSANGLRVKKEGTGSALRYMALPPF